jgi:hypothetical protein
MGLRLAAWLPQSARTQKPLWRIKDENCRILVHGSASR